MWSQLFSPYGLLLRIPVTEQRRLGPREQLRYIDLALALRDARGPAERLELLLEKATLESTARRFDVALSCLAEAEGLAPDDARRAEVLYLRGKTRYRAGAFDDAGEDLRRVLELAPDTLLAGRALLQLGRAEVNQGRFTDAITHLRRGLDVRGHTVGNAVAGHFDLVFAYVQQDRLDDAAATLDATEALGTREPGALARVTYYRGWIAFSRRRRAEAVALVERASREFAQLQDRTSHACAELSLARMELAATEIAACIDRCERARALPELRPDVPIALALLRGLALFLAGRADEAESDYLAAERLAVTAGRADLRGRALQWLAELLSWRGEHARALAALDLARSLRAGVGDRVGEVMALTTLGNVRRAMGAHAEAREAWDEARRIAEALGNTTEQARIALEETRWAIDQGDLPAAEERCAEALRLYELRGKVARRATVRRFQAEIAALRDEFDEAERLYAESLEQLSKGPNRVVLAEALASRAEARGDAGRLEDALADLDEARRLAEAVGAGALAGELQAQAGALRERHAAQALLSRYIEPKIASRLLARGPRRLAGNIQQPATILFSDIRGFTALTERLGAKEVVALLNEHFSAMTDEIASHGGTIDKFVGDAVMAVFGDPGKPRPDDAVRAVRAAIGMVRRRRAMNDERQARGLEPIRIGVGLDTGVVVMGDIGSARRLTFTVIGDPVNVASRLEGLTKVYGSDILVSAATRETLDGAFVTREIGALEVKGRAGKVAVHAVEAE